MTALHLNLDQGEEEVLASLEENRESHFVSIETKQQLLQRNQLLSVFERLSHLNGMKQCFIKRIQALPSESLISLLSRQQHLDFLYLQNVTLQADTESMRRLANVFRSHRKLRKLRFWMLKPATGTNVSLDPVISAISNIPALEEVTLIHSKVSSDEDEWTGRSLQDLCRSKSLKVLTLTFTTALKDEHIALMATSLHSNTSLKSLSIRGNLGQKAGQSIADLLRANTKLEQLRLQLSDEDHAMPIVEALHQNHNLKRMGFILPSRTAENTMTRKHFTAKMVEMLRSSNYNLQHVDMGGIWACDHDEIRFYLKANRVGRKKLLADGATRREWTKALLDHGQDLDIVFFFLSRNPTLAMSILSKLMITEPSTTLATKSRKRNREEAESKSFQDKKKFRSAQG